MTHFSRQDLLHLRSLAALNDGIEKNDAFDLIDTALALIDENVELVRQLDRIDEAKQQREDQVFAAYDDAVHDFEWRGWDGAA